MMGDNPSLTAAVSTAEAAGPSRPRQETAISCDQFMTVTSLCGASVTDGRHKKCFRHMRCLTIMDGDEEQILLRCQYTPHQCLVCNFLIEKLNYLVTLPVSDDSMAEIKAGTLALDRIRFNLEDTFRTVECTDRHVESWIFALKAKKRITFEDYKVSVNVEVLPVVNVDLNRSERNVAINF